jgi:hypothetical protein
MPARAEAKPGKRNRLVQVGGMYRRYRFLVHGGRWTRAEIGCRAGNANTAGIVHARNTGSPQSASSRLASRRLRSIGGFRHGDAHPASFLDRTLLGVVGIRAGLAVGAALGVVSRRDHFPLVPDSESAERTGQVPEPDRGVWSWVGRDRHRTGGRAGYSPGASRRL